jgi:uncharacterized protein DUF6879
VEEPSTEQAIEDLLRGCQQSALHLEMRDGYMRSDPMFVAWQAGHHDDPVLRHSYWRPWVLLIGELVGRGVEVRRARIISEPVSDYISFEYALTDTNVAAGEQVRWLPRRRATDLALPGNDFWLLDGGLVVVNHFAGDGESAGHETTTDPGLVKLCTSAFEAVWARAVPHEHYRPVTSPDR